MLIDITQIPYDEIKANSILVIRIPSGTQQDLSTLDTIWEALRTHLAPTVTILVMKGDTEVYHVDEELMNRMHWYKVTPEQKAILETEGSVQLTRDVTTLPRASDAQS